jgi:hypothetical protein
MVKTYEYQHFNRVKTRMEVLDIVSEVLSVSLERYDVEIIAESDNYLIDNDNSNEMKRFMETEIDYEDINETGNRLEVLLSGKVKDTYSYNATFMMYYALRYEDEVNRPWSPWFNNGTVTNSIRLKIRRNVEQLSNQLFSITWLYEDSCGHPNELGTGMGILVFSSGNNCNAN